MAATNVPNFLTPANDAPEVGRFLEYKRVECGLSARTLYSYDRALAHFAFCDGFVDSLPLRHRFNAEHGIAFDRSVAQKLFEKFAQHRNAVRDGRRI